MKQKNILEIEKHDDGVKIYLNGKAFAWYWTRGTTEAELKELTDRYAEVFNVAEVTHRRSQESINV